jgi:hypothetical protein
MQPPSREPSGNREWREFFRRLGKILMSLIEEAFGTVGVLALVKLVDFLIKYWFGDQARFFDVVPVRWVFDVADLVVISRLVWRIIKRFNQDE